MTDIAGYHHVEDDQNLSDDTSCDYAPALDPSGTEPHSDQYEGAVPPGYDWPTHGGYLGCLIGLMASCLIGGFAAKLIGLYTYYHQITGFANVLVILAVFGLAVIVCANLGWWFGRRFFREYAQRPTWGEDDTYAPELVTAPETVVEGSAGNQSEPSPLTLDRLDDPRFNTLGDRQN